MSQALVAVLLAAPALLSSTATAQFTADDVSGALEDPQVPETPSGDVPPVPPPGPEARAAAADESDGDVLELPEFSKTGNIIHVCGCKNTEFNFEPVGFEGLRDKSNKFIQGGNGISRDGWSNALWAWGQFIDHDIVASVDEDGEPNYDIIISNSRKSATMTLHRLVAEPAGKCRSPILVNDPRLDASMIYGNDESFLQGTLREPGTCMLRTSEGNLLPVTSGVDQAGKHRLLAGDTRVNEHGVLSTMHTVFMREHNRLCGELASETTMTPDEKFNMVRKVVMAKVQQITMKEFLPTIGISEAALKAYKPKVSNADVSVEFMIVYRFGHDLIRNTIGSFQTKSIFDGEKFMKISSAAGSSDPAGAEAQMNKLMQQAVSNKAGDLDGRFSNALRNTLFGAFGEDLATRNMFRALELGMVGYEQLAECFGVTPDRKTVLFNRLAKDDNAALAVMRENGFSGRGGPLGPVAKAILTDQFHRLLVGPSGLWWGDSPADVGPFKAEVEATTLASVLSANLPGSFSGQAMKA